MTEAQHTDRRASRSPSSAGEWGEYALMQQRIDELYRSVAAKSDDRGPSIPFRDPSENVKEFLESVVKRLDGDRGNDRYWQDKLDRERDRCDARIERYEIKLDRAEEKAKVAEKERLDALRAEDKANTALALAAGKLEAKVLEGQVATTATALAASGGRTGGMGVVLAALGTFALIVIAALALILANIPRGVPT